MCEKSCDKCIKTRYICSNNVSFCLSLTAALAMDHALGTQLKLNTGNKTTRAPINNCDHEADFVQRDD